MSFILLIGIRTIPAGIELNHMIRKGQYKYQGGNGLSPAEQFTSWLFEKQAMHFLPDRYR